MVKVRVIERNQMIGEDLGKRTMMIKINKDLIKIKITSKRLKILLTIITVL
jgi:hypothetical protein